MTGQEQVVVSPAARWKASLTVPIADRRSGDHQDQVLALRSLVRGGRATTIVVPIRDGRGPAHRAGLVPCKGRVLHSDGSPFSDGSGYAQGYSGAALSGAAALNAVQIVVTLATGLQPLPGMRFSMPDGRLHEVGNVIAFDGASRWTIGITPWLRAAYDDGTELDFETAVCRMRLASDDAAALSLTLNRFGSAAFELVEAL
ncbi:hypothetical protein [Methylobacterium gnaphalii]|nr:hypothetical protein [Methylobacterium gnaphalii]